jgi:hypothetical protein
MKIRCRSGLPRMAETPRRTAARSTSRARCVVRGVQGKRSEERALRVRHRAAQRGSRGTCSTSSPPTGCVTGSASALNDLLILGPEGLVGGPVRSAFVATVVYVSCIPSLTLLRAFRESPVPSLISAVTPRRAGAAISLPFRRPSRRARLGSTSARLTPSCSSGPSRREPMWQIDANRPYDVTARFRLLCERDLPGADRR